MKCSQYGCFTTYAEVWFTEDALAVIRKSSYTCVCYLQYDKAEKGTGCLGEYQNTYTTR